MAELVSSSTLTLDELRAAYLAEYNSTDIEGMLRRANAPVYTTVTGRLPNIKEEIKMSTNLNVMLKNQSENNPYLGEDGCIKTPDVTSYCDEVKHHTLALAGHYTGVSGWRNQQPEISAVLNMIDAINPVHSIDPAIVKVTTNPSQEYSPNSTHTNMGGLLDYIVGKQKCAHQSRAATVVHPASMWLWPFMMYCNGVIGYSPEVQDSLERLLAVRKGYNPEDASCKEVFAQCMSFLCFGQSTQSMLGWYAPRSVIPVLAHAWFDTDANQELKSWLDLRIAGLSVDSNIAERTFNTRAVNMEYYGTYNPWYFTHSSLCDILYIVGRKISVKKLQCIYPAANNSLDLSETDFNGVFSDLDAAGEFNKITDWDECVFSNNIHHEVIVPEYNYTLAEIQFMLIARLIKLNTDSFTSLPQHILKQWVNSEASTKKEWDTLEYSTCSHLPSRVLQFAEDSMGMTPLLQQHTREYIAQIVRAVTSYLNNNNEAGQGYYNKQPITNNPSAHADDLYNAMVGFGVKLLGKRGFHKDVLARYKEVFKVLCNQYLAQSQWYDVLRGHLSIMGRYHDEWFSYVVATAVLVHDYTVNGCVYGMAVTPNGVEYRRFKLVLTDGKVRARKVNYKSSPFLYNTGMGLDMRNQVNDLKCKLSKPLFYNVELNHSDNSYDVLFQVYRTGPHSCMTSFGYSDSPLIAYCHDNNDYHIAFCLSSNSRVVLERVVRENPTTTLEDPKTWPKSVWDDIEVLVRALNNGEHYIRAYGDNASAVLRTHGITDDDDWTSGQVLNAVVANGYTREDCVFRLPYLDGSSDDCGFNEDGELIQGISSIDCVGETVCCSSTSGELYVPDGESPERVECPECCDYHRECDLYEVVDQYRDTVYICDYCRRQNYTLVNAGEYADTWVHGSIISAVENDRIVTDSEVTYCQERGEEWWDEDMGTCDVTGLTYPELYMTSGVIDEDQIEFLESGEADLLREHYGLTEEDEE